MERERILKKGVGSVLIIESSYMAAALSANFDIEGVFERVNILYNVPASLLLSMEGFNTNTVVVHPSRLSDEAPILEAHRGGKTILVIKRDPPATWEEEEMYERMEKEGVAMINKRSGYLEQVPLRLLELVEEKLEKAE